MFGDSLLALNARTGKLVWYYQMVHHDIWDYDNDATPMLTTVTHNGKKVDVVAQAGKVGFLWVFNRETGEPLWPIEERPVPRNQTCPENRPGPRSRFLPNLRRSARQTFTERDLSPFLETDERAELVNPRDAGRAQRWIVHASRVCATRWRCRGITAVRIGAERYCRIPSNGEVIRRFEGFTRDAQARVSPVRHLCHGLSRKQQGRSLSMLLIAVFAMAPIGKEKPPAIPSLVDVAWTS